MTPAIASEPYCAAAPSRRISIRSIALAGMALRSTIPEPRPMLPFTLIRALECRRLPLTSTSTWSGARPRRVAGRVWSVPSVMVGRGKLKDGASDWMICAVSVRPVCLISAAVSTSTGTAASVEVRSAARVPTTANSSSAKGSRVRLKSRRLGLAGRDLDRVPDEPVTDVGDPDLVAALGELEAVAAILSRGGRSGSTGHEHPRIRQRVTGGLVNHPAGQRFPPGPGR